MAGMMTANVDREVEASGSAVGHLSAETSTRRGMAPVAGLFH